MTAATDIRTPDRRVRIFVSSTLTELAAERAAALQAITSLRQTPIMFETGARHHRARDLYRAYLSQSDVFVGIYWQRYGWVASDEQTSGLEDEYVLSGDKPKLIYVKNTHGERDLRLVELLDRIKGDDGSSYKHFDAASDLADLVADDLAVLLTEPFVRSMTAEAVQRPSLPVPPNPMVDRQTEQALLGALLIDPAVQVVTLTGPGGIGKTRLALEVGRTWLGGAPEGSRAAWFVDLAAVREPDQWVAALADALDIHSEGSQPAIEPIVDRLQGRSALVVLDNFEQVLPAAAELGRFVLACPDLTVLVTSRGALRLRGEREVRLEPLTTPLAGAVDPEVVGRSPAVRLLLERGRSVRPGLGLTAGNAAAIGEVARRLEGIPLALELAAAQLRILSPAALLTRLGARLDHALDLTAGPVDLPSRQRTLRATIEWSYDLLEEPQRTLLARLSVFAGAWTLEACEAVGAADGDLDAVDALSALVEQSLVRVENTNSDETRFRMLGTVRAYARERLTACDEVEQTVDRLAHYLVGVVRELRDALQGPKNRAAAARLDRERDDLRSALDWALSIDDAETVGWLLTPLLTYWWSRGLLAMTHDIAEKAAALPSASRLSPYESALLLGAQGMAMVVVGCTVEAEPLLTSTLEIATNLGNARLRAYALLGLGWALSQRDPTGATGRLEVAATAFEATGDGWGLTMTLSNLGLLALSGGDPAAARGMHERALRTVETLDNDYLRAQILDMLGRDAVMAGDLSAARGHYAAAADLHASLLDYEGSAYCLAGLAALALGLGRPQAAARLTAASDSARRVVGSEVWPGMQVIDRVQRAAVAAALDTPSLRAASAEGGRMRMTEALGYGLVATESGMVADPSPTSTARQQAPESIGRHRHPRCVPCVRDRGGSTGPL